MFGLFKKKPPVLPVYEVFTQLTGDFLLKDDAEFAQKCLDNDDLYIEWTGEQIIDVPWYLEDEVPSQLLRAKEIFNNIAIHRSKTLLLFDWKSDFQLDMLPEINQCLDQLGCQHLSQIEVDELNSYYEKDKAIGAYFDSLNELESILDVRGLEYHDVITNSDSFAFFVCLKGKGAKYKGLEYREFQPFEF